MFLSRDTSSVRILERFAWSHKILVIAATYLPLGHCGLVSDVRFLCYLWMAEAKATVLLKKARGKKSWVYAQDEKRLSSLSHLRVHVRGPDSSPKMFCLRQTICAVLLLQRPSHSGHLRLWLTSNRVGRAVAAYSRLDRLLAYRLRFGNAYNS